MRTMSYTESRAKCAETLDSVGHGPVVMVALDDYESLKETAYLFSDLTNARRLLVSIDQLENGGGTVHRLVYKLVEDEVRIAACRYHHGR